MTHVTNDQAEIRRFLEEASVTTEGRLDELGRYAAMVRLPLERKRLPADPRGLEWFVFENDVVRLDIEARPSYCNRGAYKVLAESKDPSKLIVDFADAFPRYYFFPMACALEMAEWLRQRRQLPGSK